MWDVITITVNDATQVANHYIDARVEMNLVNAHWGAVTTWGMTATIMIIIVAGVVTAICTTR